MKNTISPPEAPKGFYVSVKEWEVFDLHFTDGKILTLVVRIEEHPNEDPLTAHVHSCSVPAKQKKFTPKNRNDLLTSFRCWPSYIAQTRKKTVIAGFDASDGSIAVCSFDPNGSMKFIEMVSPGQYES